MKKILNILYFLIIIIGVACTNSTATPDIDKSLPVVNATEQTDVPVTTESLNAPVTIDANNNMLPQSSAANNVAINPPHGEPGHDCNVAVGSPLNAAAKSINAPVQLPIVTGTDLPLNISPKAGVRLNPPHGEAGHDCNVQVGQPLS